MDQSAAQTALTWKDVLAGERESDYFKQLLQFIDEERAAGKSIYPANPDIFNALALTPFDHVKVVILGQDPYHGPGQAHGLCFSVKRGVPSPPSLVNILLELKNDLGLDVPPHGCLESWAKQGVLLLNTVMTVEQGKPQAHANRGWERFTDRVVKELNDRKENLVFLLWGSPAQKKAASVDTSKHLVIKTPHPSPLSAHRGFFGSKPFSRTNQYLRERGLGEIDWRIQ